LSDNYVKSLVNNNLLHRKGGDPANGKAKLIFACKNDEKSVKNMGTME